jgi:hypothetical protein
MKTEQITWHELPQDGMPDAEVTVLAEIRDPDGDGTEVWPAWWDGKMWREAGCAIRVEPHRVVAWADVPAGVTC